MHFRSCRRRRRRCYHHHHQACSVYVEAEVLCTVI